MTMFTWIPPTHRVKIRKDRDTRVGTPSWRGYPWEFSCTCGVRMHMTTWRHAVTWVTLHRHNVQREVEVDF